MMPLKFFLVLSLFIFSEKNYAIPTPYSGSCGPLRIENETNSTLLRDDHDCHLVWVLPPTSGLSRVTSFTPSGNMGLCRAVKDNQETYSLLTKQIREQVKKQESFAEKIYQEEEILFNLNSKRMDYEKLPEVIEIVKLTDALEDCETKIAKLMGKIGAGGEDIDEFKSELKDAKEERVKLREELRALKGRYLKESRNHAELVAMINGQKEKILFLNNRYGEAQKERLQLISIMDSFMKKYDSSEGGYAHLDYNTGWDENVQKLTKRYHDQYDFRAVPTKGVKIFATFAGGQDYLSTRPMLLSYSFTGMKNRGWRENNSIDLSALPSHLSGSIQLNLTASCQLYYENFFEAINSDQLKRRENIEKEKFDFSVVVNYLYPAVFKFNVKATYNLHKMYQKMVSVSSRGHFFTSKMAQTIAEDRNDSDYFVFDWLEEEGKYTNEQKMEIKSEIKKDLMARVLHNMAIPSSEPKVEVPVPNLRKYPPAGVVMAKGLGDLCGGWNIYCQGATWMLITANSLFGGDKDVNSFKSSYDKMSSERWTTSDTRWVVATTAFYGL